MRHGIPSLRESLRGKRFDAIVRDVNCVHQIIGVGDIAAQMNPQFQDGKCLGTGAVYNSSTQGVPTSIGETPSFTLQEVLRVCLLA
jgi:hypothetical protein